MSTAFKERLDEAIDKDPMFAGWLDAVLEIHELRRQTFDPIGINEISRMMKMAQPKISNALNPHMKMDLCKKILKKLRRHVDGK